MKTMNSLILLKEFEVKMQTNICKISSAGTSNNCFMWPLKKYWTQKTESCFSVFLSNDDYHSSIVPLPGSRSSGVCALLLCILSVTWPMMMQTRTSLIPLLFYTIQFIFSPLMHLYTATLRRPLSLLSLCRIFAVSVACPCSQSAWATTASPAPLPGRVVVGRRSHSSDHHRWRWCHGQ